VIDTEALVWHVVCRALKKREFNLDLMAIAIRVRKAKSNVSRTWVWRAYKYLRNQSPPRRNDLLDWLGETLRLKRTKRQSRL